MAKRKPTSSKSAPSGPSAASSGGGDSRRDRNTRGDAASDTTKRGAAVEGEESDEGGGIGAGGEGEISAQAQDTFDPHAKQSKAQDYVVVDGGTIDDGKGGKMKVCKAGDVVSLSPERAAHFQSHGVPLITKKEHQEQQKQAAQ